ncbi:MAG TPA: hypothetical protein VFW44_02190 [Bryobacteraceae bacterium]|nr:hypothetical protein [Bryobacteraceae bacterium]
MFRILNFAFFSSAITGLFWSICSAQPVMLAYRPVAAEYSTALDRIIFISGNPNVVHIYDPASHHEVTIDLVQPPLSLAVSPDGLHAAVGHDALLSYVNLKTATVEKTISIAATADHVVLSSSWIYVFPNAQGSSLSVSIASGKATPNSSVFFTNGSGERLNTAVNAIYGTRDGTSPNDVEEYDISTGPITRQFDSPYHGDFCIFGPVWFSPDGSRVYTGCGTIFHASKDPNLDMYYLSTLTGVSSIGAFAESSALHEFALIEGGPVYPSTITNDSSIFLFDSTYLQPVGQFALASFSVNGNDFQSHGKWLFLNSASTALYAVAEADQTSGLLNDFGVQTITLAKPTPCGASFVSPSADVPASGTLGKVDISASAACIYQATTTSSWLQIVSGGYGSGDGSLTYSTRPNPSSTSRSATISLGPQIFTINQDKATPQGPVALLGYNAVDAANDKPLSKIILISAGPHELHIYDPGTNSEQAVSLAMPPLCVSVRPDGLYAAVGHDGWVSYVNLKTGAVEKVVQVITDVHHIVLAGNGYMYLFPERDWSDVYSLQVSTGTLTSTPAIYLGRIPRLYADDKSLYLGGNWFSKWDISAGIPKVINTSGFTGMTTCGNLWLTEDGKRMFVACAKAYTTSEIPAQDIQYNGTLSATASIVWADESKQQAKTAVIPTSGYSPTSSGLQPSDTQVQIYGDAYLGYMGAVPLPKFTAGGQSFPGHGLFVFWNSGSTALIVVMQADPAAQLLSGTAITQVSPSAVLQPNAVSVVNSASQAPARLAPEEIVAIYGSGLGDTKRSVFALDPATGKVNTDLSGTQVFFDSKPAPVLYASATQVNAIVPYEINPPNQTVMQVGYQGVLSPATTFPTASAIPAVFTVSGSGSGQAVALNQDGTICDSAHPAVPGSYVTVYFTGGGTTNPSGATGSVSGPLAQVLEPNGTGDGRRATGEGHICWSCALFR